MHAENSRFPSLPPAPQPFPEGGTDCSEQSGPFAIYTSWLGLLFIAAHSAADLLQDGSRRLPPLLPALAPCPLSQAQGFLRDMGWFWEQAVVT